MQGDKEKAQGMAVSPLMDRATQGGMTRSQVSPCLQLSSTGCSLASGCKRISVLCIILCIIYTLKSLIITYYEVIYYV